MQQSISKLFPDFFPGPNPRIYNVASRPDGLLVWVRPQHSVYNFTFIEGLGRNSQAPSPTRIVTTRSFTLFSCSVPVNQQPAQDEHVWARLNMYVTRSDMSGHACESLIHSFVQLFSIDQQLSRASLPCILISSFLCSSAQSLFHARTANIPPQTPLAFICCAFVVGR